MCQALLFMLGVQQKTSRRKPCPVEVLSIAETEIKVKYAVSALEAKEAKGVGRARWGLQL